MWRRRGREIHHFRVPIQKDKTGLNMFDLITKGEKEKDEQRSKFHSKHTTQFHPVQDKHYSSSSPTPTGFLDFLRLALESHLLPNLPIHFHQIEVNALAHLRMKQRRKVYVFWSSWCVSNRSLLCFLRDRIMYDFVAVLAMIRRRIGQLRMMKKLRGDAAVRIWVQEKHYYCPGDDSRWSN